jgi:hypothetical protein
MESDIEQLAAQTAACKPTFKPTAKGFELKAALFVPAASIKFLW